MHWSHSPWWMLETSCNWPVLGWALIGLQALLANKQKKKQLASSSSFIQGSRGQRAILSCRVSMMLFSTPFSTLGFPIPGAPLENYTKVEVWFCWVPVVFGWTCIILLLQILIFLFPHHFGVIHFSSYGPGLPSCSHNVQREVSPPQGLPSSLQK